MGLVPRVLDLDQRTDDSARVCCAAQKPLTRAESRRLSQEGVAWHFRSKTTAKDGSVRCYGRVSVCELLYAGRQGCAQDTTLNLQFLWHLCRNNEFYGVANRALRRRSVAVAPTRSGGQARRRGRLRTGVTPRNAYLGASHTRAQIGWAYAKQFGANVVNASARNHLALDTRSDGANL